MASLASNARVDWGLRGQYFFSGVKWGESVECCYGFKASDGEKGGIVVLVVRCDVMLVRFSTLLASPHAHCLYVVPWVVWLEVCGVDC